jgi:hypothetical protein
VLSRNMASNSALAMASRSGASRRGRQVTGGSGVVRMWCGDVAHLTLDTRGANEVRKFVKEGVDRSTATDDFGAGDLRTGGLGRGG